MARMELRNGVKSLTLLIAGIAIGATLPSVVASKQPTADDAVRRAVAEVKNGIVEGHRNRDRESLDQLYTDDYIAFDARGGMRTKEDLLNALPSDPEMVEGRYELVSVRSWGSIAVASGHGRMLYRDDDGRTRVSEYDSVNVFELRDGRWLYAAAFLP